MATTGDGVRLTHAFPSTFVSRQQERARSKGVTYPFKRTETLEDIANALGWRDAKSLQNKLKTEGERGKHVTVGSAPEAPAAAASSGVLDRLLSHVSDVLPEGSAKGLLALRDAEKRRVSPVGSIEDEGEFDLVYAPADARKSATDFGRRQILAFVDAQSRETEDGRFELPKVAHISQRPTKSGPVQILRDTLPPDQKNDAAVVQITDTRERAVNPFDTPLGMRYPTLDHENLLTKLLETVLAPRAEGAIVTGRSGPPSRSRRCA